MTEQGEIPVGVDVEPVKAKKEYDWIPVSLPKELVARIDAMYATKGVRSRAAYVRSAILVQLAKDGEGNGPEPGVPL